MRGATITVKLDQGIMEFQSTLPVRGATDVAIKDAAEQAEFQSTLPVRGATGLKVPSDRTIAISIHAPREGSDRLSSAPRIIVAVISIHAPREGSD